MGFRFFLWDSRDIHELVFDIAEHHRARDMTALYRRLPAHRLFAPVRSPQNLPQGTIVVADGTSRFTIQAVSFPGSGTFLPFFFDSTDPRLSSGFAEFSALEAFTMASQAADDIAGLVLRNRSNSWVALRRVEIAKVLETGGLR